MADKIRYLKQQVNAIFSDGISILDDLVPKGTNVTSINFGNFLELVQEIDGTWTVNAIGGGGGVGTDLGAVYTTENVTVTSNTGDNVTITAATLVQAGFFTPTMLGVLNGAVQDVLAGSNVTIDYSIANNPRINVTIPDVNLAYVAAPDKGTVTNDSGDGFEIPTVTPTNAGLATPGIKQKAEGSVQDIEADSANVTVTDKGNGLIGISVATTGGNANLPYLVVPDVTAASYTIPKETFDINASQRLELMLSSFGDQVINIIDTDSGFFLSGTGVIIRNLTAGKTATLQTVGTGVIYRDPDTNNLIDLQNNPISFTGDIEVTFQGTNKEFMFRELQSSDLLSGSEYGVGFPSTYSNRKVLDESKTTEVAVVQTTDVKFNRESVTRVQPFTHALPASFYDDVPPYPIAFGDVYLANASSNVTIPAPYDSYIARNVEGSNVDLIIIRASRETYDFAKHLEFEPALRGLCVSIGHLDVNPAAQTISVVSSAFNMADGDKDIEYQARPAPFRNGNIKNDISALKLNRDSGSIIDNKKNERKFSAGLFELATIYRYDANAVGYQTELVSSGFDVDDLKKYVDALGAAVQITGTEHVVHTMSVDQYNSISDECTIVLATDKYADRAALEAATLTVDYGPVGVNFNNGESVITDKLIVALLVVDVNGFVEIINCAGDNHENFKVEPLVTATNTDIEITEQVSGVTFKVGAGVSQNMQPATESLSGAMTPVYVKRLDHLFGISTAQMQDPALNVGGVVTVELPKTILDGRRFVRVTIDEVPTEDSNTTPITEVIITTESAIAGPVMIQVEMGGTPNVPTKFVINSFGGGATTGFELARKFDTGVVAQINNNNGNQYVYLGGTGKPLPGDQPTYQALASYWESQDKSVEVGLDELLTATETNATAIQDLINNPVLQSRIVNADGAVAVLDDGSVASISQGGYATLTSNGTHSSSPISGTFETTTIEVNGKAFDDATSYQLNTSLTPYAATPTNVSIREQVVVSPPDAIGTITIRCNTVNGVIQARSNSNVTGNVFQGLSGGGESLIYDITGIKPFGSSIPFTMKVANNASVGQARTGKVRFTHDGVVTEESWTAPSEVNNPFLTLNYSFGLTPNSSVTTATIEIVNDAGQIGVLWSEIAINLRQRYGPEITQRTNVAEDRQFDRIAAWVDSRIADGVDVDTFPDDSVHLGTDGLYRIKNAILGTNIQKLLAEGWVALPVLMQAGVHRYRFAEAIAVGSGAVSGEDRFKVITQDGTYSSQGEYEFGYRARIVGATTGKVPSFTFNRKGTFNWNGVAEADPLRKFSALTTGDADTNGSVFYEVDLWHDGTAGVYALFLWFPNSLSDTKLKATVEVDADLTGLTAAEFVTRNLQYRVDDTVAGQYNRATGLITQITTGLPYYTGDIEIAGVPLIIGESTALTQEPFPDALDTVFQIEFGAAQANQYVDINVDGSVTFLQERVVTIRISVNVGRNGGTGESELRLKAQLNGVNVGRTIPFTVDNNKIVFHDSNPFELSVSEGDELKLFMYRDSINGGNNSGGLYLKQSSLAGWDDSPSARIAIY